MLKFDIKGFKEINGKFGLPHGDKLLAQIGTLLRDYSASSELMEVKAGDIRACRTMADSFFLLHFGEAVDYFDFKANALLDRIRAETGIKIKRSIIINNYRADQVKSLEWGHLI